MDILDESGAAILDESGASILDESPAAGTSGPGRLTASTASPAAVLTAATS